MRRLPLFALAAVLIFGIGVYASIRPRGYVELDLRTTDTEEQILKKCEAAGLKVTGGMGSGPKERYTTSMGLSDGRSIVMVTRTTATSTRVVSVGIYEPDEKRR